MFTQTLFDNNFSPDEIGYKAYNVKKIYEFLQGTEYKVPSSLILPSFVFEKCLIDNQFDKTIFEELFLNEIYAEVLGYFGNKKLIVRSSSTIEDSPVYSMSGVYDSFLNINTKEKFLNAILGCFKSVFNPSIEKMVNKSGNRYEQGKMAILIQEMVQEMDTAGVCFTMNPTNNNQEFVVEYSSNGVNVVSGKGNITREIIQPNKIISNERISKIIGVSRKLLEKFKHSLDIEWGISNNDIYVFQCRPIITYKFNVPVLSSELENIPYIKGLPISPGIAFGRINAKDVSSITYINDYDNFFDNILSINAAILNQGGILSHQANLLRENLIPAILFETELELKTLEDNFIILDGFNGRIYDLSSLGQEHRDTLLMYYIKYLDLNNLVKKYNHITNIEFLNIKEAVYMDIDLEEIHTSIGQYYLSKELDQHIYHCDLIENNFMVGTFDCIRIQEDSKIRIQFKKILINDDDFRQEEQVNVYFENLISAKTFLKKIGLLITQQQHRKIERYNFEGVYLNFIKWPGSPIYLGVEFQENSFFLEFQNNIPNLPKPKGLNGKEIFQHLKIES